QVQDLLLANENKIAAIIIEPVVGNMGLVLPDLGFLQSLRKLCDDHGIVLIFDEVMTGFRLAQGGVQELMSVLPDMTTLGKIIGGGLPVGAYGGRKEIMDFVAPQGPVYQAGTLSGNPIALSAGMAMLTYLKDNPDLYTDLNAKGQLIREGLQKIDSRLGLSNQINQIGSMFTYFFTDQPVRNFEDAKKSDTPKFGRYFRKMLDAGIYLAPSQFESLFFSTALDNEHISYYLNAHEEALKSL
ncbi:MAG TPA: aminotransferase class III-fold pyridoxal phosphate-dependent enzyme, partial [Catalimonadaceae bacterium]|nr:aminotransferase class III-fold pyridoxal phosphate-dependent enzyme [Catalimonadaceae bacterium]